MRNNLIWYMMGINLEYLGCNREAQLSADKWKIISLWVKNSIVNECWDAAAGWVRGKEWEVTGEKWPIQQQRQGGEIGYWAAAEGGEQRTPSPMARARPRAGDGEAKCRLWGEMHLLWTEMVLEGQKSLKNPKIPYWREAEFCGFGAHWHKTRRYFFHWYQVEIWIDVIQSRTEEAAKDLQIDPCGGLRGKPSFWSTALLGQPLW